MVCKKNFTSFNSSKSACLRFPKDLMAYCSLVLFIAAHSWPSCACMFSCHLACSKMSELSCEEMSVQHLMDILRAMTLKVVQCLSRAARYLHDNKVEISEHNDPINAPMCLSPFSLNFSYNFNFSCPSACTINTCSCNRPLDNKSSLTPQMPSHAKGIV